MLLYYIATPIQTGYSNCDSCGYAPQKLAKNLSHKKLTRLVICICVYALAGNNRSSIISYSLVMKEIQSEKKRTTLESAYEIFFRTLSDVSFGHCISSP